MHDLYHGIFKGSNSYFNPYNGLFKNSDLMHHSACLATFQCLHNISPAVSLRHTHTLEILTWPTLGDLAKKRRSARNENKECRFNLVGISFFVSHSYKNAAE